MNLNCDEIHISSNIDETLKFELIGCKFRDINGEVLRGIVTFPRVIIDETNSFKIDGVSPMSEIMHITILTT